MKKSFSLRCITFILVIITLFLLFPFKTTKTFAENNEETTLQDYYTKIDDIGTTKYIDENKIFNLNKEIGISRNYRSDNLYQGLSFDFYGNFEKNKDWLVFEDKYNNVNPYYHDTREYKFSLYRVDQNNINCFLEYEIIFYFFTASKIEATYKIHNRNSYTTSLSNHELVYIGLKEFDISQKSYLDFVPTGFSDYENYGYTDRYYSNYNIVTDYERQGYKTLQILDFDVIGGHGEEKKTDLQFVRSILDKETLLNYKGRTDTFKVLANVSNSYTKYFIRFEYNLKKYYEKTTTKKILFIKGKAKKIGFNTREGYLQSEPMSIYDYCKNQLDYYEYTGLVDKYGEAEAQYMYSVVNNLIDKEVKISYFEPISDANGKSTPFAKKVTRIAKVPIALPKMTYHYMANALSKANFNCNGAVAYNFEYDNLSNTYNAVYEESIWLKSKTEDGNSANFFLRIQKSYEDYYYPFVKSGIIPEGMYNYVYNEIQSKYPETQGIAKNELYGFWGFVPVPDTYSFNSLWKCLFDTPTTFNGVVDYVCFNDKITTKEYNKLLDEYDYNFIEKVWNDFISFLDGGTSASFYLFYADNTQKRIMIAENGSSEFNNNNGLVVNVTKKTVSKGISSIGKSLKNFGNKISDFFGSFNIKKALIVIACIFVVLFVLWFIIKIIKLIKDE